MEKFEIPKEYGAPAKITGFKNGKPVAIGLEDGRAYVLSARNDFKPGHYVGIKDTSVRKLPDEVVAKLANNGYNAGIQVVNGRIPAISNSARDERKSRSAYRRKISEQIDSDTLRHLTAQLAELGLA